MRRGLFLTVLIGLSCTAKEPAAIPAVEDYFPISHGYWQIYAVDSVVVDQNVEKEYTYELKTIVLDSFPATNGGWVYMIQRARRLTSSDPWTSMESWSARVNAYQAVVNEGNTPYVKILSPLADGKSWNGNAMNSLDGTEPCSGGGANNCDNYVIADLSKAFTTSLGKNFDNTLTVVQNDNKDFIVSFDKRLEVYALNIGMVYKESTKLNYCTSSDACLGTQFVESGLKYKQTLTDHGVL